MQAHIERLLAEFVDRESEMARFREMLERPDRTVFAVWGPAGVGKSSLQAKMIHEVANRGIDKAEVTWTETRNHDFMGIARKIRDDLGPSRFLAFTDLINFFTVPQYQLNVRLTGDARIAVAEGAQVAGSARIGDMAGIMIKDVMLTEPRADMEVSAGERRARLTDAFVECMGQACADRPAVIFFDATEKMTEETEDWVWGELLPAACEGRMGRTKFVLCGRREPEIDRLWRGTIDVAELRSLSREHVLDYLARRGVEAASREPIADMLLVVSKGNMLDLAVYLDGYLRLQERRAEQGARG